MVVLIRPGLHPPAHLASRLGLGRVSCNGRGQDGRGLAASNQDVEVPSVARVTTFISRRLHQDQGQIEVGIWSRSQHLLYSPSEMLRPPLSLADHVTCLSAAASRS